MHIDVYVIDAIAFQGSNTKHGFEGALFSDLRNEKGSVVL